MLKRGVLCILFYIICHYKFFCTRIRFVYCYFYILITQSTTSVSAVNTTVANMRPTTADNKGDIVKPTDLWIEVNGMPTRVLCWGQALEEEISNSRDLKKLVLCVCGNPGITEFYEKFLLEVYKSLRVPVWVISHAGTIFF